MAGGTARKRGLGMGLSALLGTDALAEDAGADGAPGAVERMPIERLRPSPLQPRRHFDHEELEALAASIRARGLIQPIVVRRAPGPASAGDHEIVAGERRWRACQLAGLHEAPVVVRELSDKEALELALIENVQRRDLSALEEADAYRRLIDEFGHGQEALGAALGKSRSHVANTLRLLGLPEAVRRMVEAGELTAGHARALLATDEPERLAKEVATRGLSVRQTEELVRKAAAGPAAANGARARDANVASLESDLRARLGLKVEIKPRGKGGVISFGYTTSDQLDGLLRRINEGGT